MKSVALASSIVFGCIIFAQLPGCGESKPKKESKGDVGCLSCHQGIDHAHPGIANNRCVLCHGGDGESLEKVSAHVPVPSDWEQIRGEALPPAPHGFIKDFSSDQLAKLEPSYLRFINPSDLRVVSETCASCHEAEAQTVPTSVMATNSGHYFPTLFLAGAQKDQEAIYGAQALKVDDCEQAGTSCELTPLRSPEQEAIAAAISELKSTGNSQALEEVAYSHYLAKSCNTCHQSAYPRNDSPGLFRSTGCASCHVLYAEDGLYDGQDASIPSGSPVHPKKHEITAKIPSEQCGTCHFQGGRIGLLFRGIREGGFGETPEFAKTIDRPLYGHAPGFYIEDEDTRNDIDETPPDIHYQKGMHCADCHMGSDVHGDGKLHASSKTQVDIQCEDCHGNARQPATPNENGEFLTAGGRVLSRLRENERGQIILTGIVDGEEHVVSQPSALLLGLDDEHPMKIAMGENPHGWSHTDSLSCDACHTSYNQQCVGCHVTYDLRIDGIDGQTGLSTPGVAISKRGFTTLEQVLLGQRADGRIQSVIASQQVQLTVVGSEELGGEGTLLLGEETEAGQWPRGKFRSRDGVSTPGFAPFFQHTVSAKARECASCHRRDDSSAELTRIAGVYGFGTGEFMLPGANGENIDPFRFLDEDGDSLSVWQQPGTGPVNREARERAMSVLLSQLP